MKSTTYGLLGAWIIHDTEELVTMSSWSKSERSPIGEISNRQAATAIALTGCVMAAASASGSRSGGKSKF